MVEPPPSEDAGSRVLRAAAACLPAESLAAIYTAATRAGRRVCDAIDAAAPFDVPAVDLQTAVERGALHLDMASQDGADTWELICFAKWFAIYLNAGHGRPDMRQHCAFLSYAGLDPRLHMWAAIGHPDARPALAAACTLISRLYPWVDPRAVPVSWCDKDQPVPLVECVRVLLAGA